MNDRLIDGGGPEDERELLRAGIDEAPPAGSLDRALLRAGLGASVVVAASTASATAGTGWLAAKVALAVLLGGAVIGGVIVARSPESARGVPWLAAATTASATTPAEVPSVASGASAPADPSGPAGSATDPVPVEAPPIAATASASAAPPSRVASSAPAPADSPDSIARQTAAIDEARRALAGGDAQGALAALGRYEREFPRGAFGQEVTVIRIQALLKSGDRAGATRLGKRFLASNPRSPLARRIEAMLDLGPR